MLKTSVRLRYGFGYIRYRVRDRFDKIQNSRTRERLAFKIAIAKQIAIKKVAKTVVNELIYLLFLLRSEKNDVLRQMKLPPVLLLLVSVLKV